MNREIEKKLKELEQIYDEWMKYEDLEPRLRHALHKKLENRLDPIIERLRRLGVEEFVVEIEIDGKTKTYDLETLTFWRNGEYWNLFDFPDELECFVKNLDKIINALLDSVKVWIETNRNDYKESVERLQKLINLL